MPEMAERLTFRHFFFAGGREVRELKVLRPRIFRFILKFTKSVYTPDNPVYN